MIWCVSCSTGLPAGQKRRHGPQGCAGALPAPRVRQGALAGGRTNPPSVVVASLRARGHRPGRGGTGSVRLMRCNVAPPAWPSAGERAAPPVLSEKQARLTGLRRSLVSTPRSPKPFGGQDDDPSLRCGRLPQALGASCLPRWEQGARNGCGGRRRGAPRDFFFRPMSEEGGGLAPPPLPPAAVLNVIRAWHG